MYGRNVRFSNKLHVIVIYLITHIIVISTNIVIVFVHITINTPYCRVLNLIPFILILYFICIL